jgi:hypothetical protein
VKADYVNGSNVVFIGARLSQVKYPAISQVEAYWTALSDGGGIPLRSQIDPRGIEDALEYSFIPERVAPGVARFRLAGGHLTDLMGMEVRGMPMTAMFEPEARKMLADLTERVCNTPELIEVSLDGGKGIGRGALQAKMFLAPLRDDRGQVNRLFGCLQSEGRIGRQPRRFSITDFTATKTGNDLTYPLPDNEPRVLQELAEAQATFAHKPKTEKPDTTRPALPLFLL